MTTVALSCERPLIRSGLQTLLAVAPCELVVLEAGASHDADVVIHDVNDLYQHEHAHNLHKFIKNCPAPVIVIGPAGRTDLVNVARRAGASAALTFDVQGLDLVQSVIAVARRHSDPDLDLPEAAIDLTDDPEESGLSQQEERIVTLIGQGLSNKDISASAHLSINTVKTHIRGAYRKMGVSSRSQAVRWAFAEGIVWQDDSAPL